MSIRKTVVGFNNPLSKISKWKSRDKHISKDYLKLRRIVKSLVNLLNSLISFFGGNTSVFIEVCKQFFLPYCLSLTLLKKYVLITYVDGCIMVHLHIMYVILACGMGFAMHKLLTSIY